MSCDALVANAVDGCITLDVDYKKAKGSSGTLSNSWGWTFWYKGHGFVKKKTYDVTMSRMVRIKRHVPFYKVWSVKPKVKNVTLYYERPMPIRSMP